MFTVRRTEKNWAGLWTGLTVEKFLMRAIKRSAGLTCGRGTSDSVLQR